ncbi:MAG: molybdopterin-binding protein [Candidatus Devosia symbiotica]|nr:molybdopterin-binding protein [Candidatus Devosia symbiotica]
MPSADSVTAGLLVIGDEILSGRTKDINISTTADFCTDRGIELKEVRVVSDETDEIVDAINALRVRYTYVFTTGGIGPTHDDITADAVAKAFGVALPINAQAREMLESRWKQTSTEVNEARLRMARIPEGADLIVNSVSAAPGFRIGNVHVMAGVPVIMRAMLEALSPTLKCGKKVFSVTVKAAVGEGTIGGPLRALQAEYPDVKMGSYPQMGQNQVMTELVLRSTDVARLEEAAIKVRVMVAAHAKSRHCRTGRRLIGAGGGFAKQRPSSFVQAHGVGAGEVI